MRLEGQGIGKLGADGNLLLGAGAGIGAFLLSGIHCHWRRSGFFHYHRIHSALAPEAESRGLAISDNQNLVKHGIIVHGNAPAGHAPAGGIDAHGRHAVIGHRHLRPPVPGHCVDALVPYRSQGLNPSGSLQGKGIFRAGVGVGGEARKLQRKVQARLFPAILPVEGPGLSVDEPEYLQPHGVGVSGLVIKIEVGHSLGGNALGNQHLFAVPKQRNLRVSRAVAAAESGRYFTVHRLGSGQEYRLDIGRNILVLRAQNQDFHLCRAFSAPLFHAGLEGV